MDDRELVQIRNTYVSRNDMDAGVITKLLSEVLKLREDKEELSKALRLAASGYRSKAVSAESMRKQADEWYDIADQHGTPMPRVSEITSTFEGGPDSVEWLREQRRAT